MTKLFGIPINQMMIVLLVIFGAGAVFTTLVALRNRVVFKLGVRNIPRRRAQTILIVLGLMLATLLFSASLATGDTLTHSIRLSALRHLGEVDIVVVSESHEASGRLGYFDATHFERVRRSLASSPDVEAIAPLARESAPVLAPESGQNEPRVDVLGMDARWMEGFDPLTDERGNALQLASLSADQVYLSRDAARKLDVSVGNRLFVFLGPEPTTLLVAGIYREGGHPAADLSLVMPLSRLQALTGNGGRINSIIVTNRGGSIAGAERTGAVLPELEPLLEGTGLKAETVKKDALDEAELWGGIFSSIFLLFGQFSIAAGILLIFLIFVMLAAERRHELGIARAVGMQRGHVVRMFVFEGAAYALLAAAVGSLLGVGVGWGMVRIMAIAFGQVDLTLTYAFNWRSVVIAYTLGMTFTFAVVLISSWRVSRLNIVRAIRDIPEPSLDRKSLRGVVLTILMLALGALLTVAGLQAKQAGVFLLGTSLVIIGVPLLARRFGCPDRPVFTAAGVGLVAWWLMPPDMFESLFPEMRQGIELFFLSGIMIVIGGVWTVIYNSDVLLAAVVLLFGRIRGLPPVLKTAVSYPLQSRFRTGITLAMFSLVVFTLVVMSFIIHATAGLFENTERLSGGFHIRAQTSYTNPIADIQAALQEADGIGPGDFEAIASFTGAPLRVRQADTDQEFVDLVIQGVNADYSETVTYKFTLTAEGYDTPREVWRALQDEPGTVVIPPMLVPTRTDYNVGAPPPPLRLEGFWLQDETLPEVYIQARDPRTGNEARLRVIGVLDQTALYAMGMIASQDTLSAILGQPKPPQAYMFRLKDGRDAEATAKALEASFLEHGMQTEVMAEEILRNARTNLMVNNLLQGFMGLGLVVGIAALGVIAARSVVERRQQIGVLRALGFQKEMVQRSFLLESSFVALLGIGLGIALGVGVSYQVIDAMSADMEGITYRVPWLNLLLIVAVAYGAALLTTYLPARQAANVYPAEALRYE